MQKRIKKNKLLYTLKSNILIRCKNMNTMKKLYALLIILIILYVGINVAANNLPFTHTNSLESDSNNNNAAIGDSGFPKLQNFTDTKINDTAVKYNNSDNTTIYLEKLDNSQNISDIASKTYKTGYTSNQTINQNGITAYFLYNESVNSYNVKIFFNANKQNYEISGNHISYENSDKFINTCKSIIDAYASGNSNGFSRW